MPHTHHEDRPRRLGKVSIQARDSQLGFCNRCLLIESGGHVERSGRVGSRDISEVQHLDHSRLGGTT